MCSVTASVSKMYISSQLLPKSAYYSWAWAGRWCPHDNSQPQKKWPLESGQESPARSSSSFHLLHNQHTKGEKSLFLLIKQVGKKTFLRFLYLYVPLEQLGLSQLEVNQLTSCFSGHSFFCLTFLQISFCFGDGVA